VTDTVSPDLEEPQGRGDATDAVTVAFGDRGQDLYGVARVGLVPGDPPTASGMGLLFAGSEPVSVRAEGGVEIRSHSFNAAAAAGVSTAVVEPLRRWRAAFDGVFELELEALAPPAFLAAGTRTAQAGGMEGYEQLCRVRGTVTVDGQPRHVDCLGQRGHSWGRPDWSRIALARTVSAWLDDGSGVTITAVRPAGAKHHSDEAVAAWLLEAGEPVPVAEPLVSTTYDAEGRQRHAGLELWLGDGDDSYPHRAAGEVVCGTTLDLGALRLDCAFFEWRMQGRSGVGRYDVLRRAA
jgi:hypothetical protein